LANHKSALKRARQNENRRMRNKTIKTRIKTTAKSVQLAIDNGSMETATQTLDDAKSVIDRAAKKGVIHKKTASRKISRLTKRVNAITG
jgi:small subunit ribosomal protein S20